jgi:hypothetical protein
MSLSNVYFYTCSYLATWLLATCHSHVAIYILFLKKKRKKKDNFSHVELIHVANQYSFFFSFFWPVFLSSPRRKLPFFFSFFFFPSSETSARSAKSSPSFPNEIQSRKSPKNHLSTALPTKYQQSQKITKNQQQKPKITTSSFLFYW